MKKKIETWLIFIFLTVFTMGTIYPILNIIGISLRKDNAFQSKSLAFISANSGWDSYLKLLTETQFLILFYIFSKFHNYCGYNVMYLVMTTTNSSTIMLFDV